MAMGLSGAPVIVLLGGIIGVELAPSPAWSTLPIAMMVMGTALFTIPAALLMRVIGRRYGYMTGSMAAAGACGLGVYAINAQSFLLFNGAAFFIGANLAFVQQYRFGAAESVPSEKVSQAVSLVLLGGVAAAFIGPELAKQAKNLLPYGLYSGSFAALSVLYMLNTAAFILFVKPQRVHEDEEGERRSLSSVIRQPLYLTAVMAGMVSYGVMSFIMTATPVSMHIIDRLSIDQTTWVIQSHILAMFIPSLFTGSLIARFGLTRIMSAGSLLMGGCVATALLDRTFVHYWLGLVMLGVGWNFLFVGGTTLLTRTYRPGERFRAQAVNDFAVFGFQAAASMSAGTVIFALGWEVVNAASLPVLFLVLGTILVQRRRIENSMTQRSSIVQ
jgi:predicted MFS family arabinose efflux permease